jgi:hypothetical protein
MPAKRTSGKAFNGMRPTIFLRPDAARRCGVALAVLTGVLVSACATVEDIAGPLPEAMRTTMSDVDGRGYPDLTKVARAPTNLPTTAAFDRIESRLVQERRAVDANRSAAVLTPAQQSVAWADVPRAQMNSDPRSADVPDTLDAAIAWAQAERARMEALLRQLPPVQGVPN